MAVTYLWSASAASAALRTRLSSRRRLSRSGLANPITPSTGPPTPRVLVGGPSLPEPFSRGVCLSCRNPELPFISNRPIADLDDCGSRAEARIPPTQAMTHTILPGAAEQCPGPQPDRRGWLDEECQ